MNPFKHNSKDLYGYYMDWDKMNSRPYNKKTVDPYTKVRMILMNGTEFESNWFMHQLARHTADRDVCRAVACVRAQEQQQQKRLASLKPLDESVLETTVSYEQLAIDLTAILAKHETDENNLKSLNFALLEDFDHLYRYANLMKTEYGTDAKTLVGGFTEIMPGRPTISEHRLASDNVKRSLVNRNADLFSVLVANIITAAEQQTMNFYMNLAAFYPTEAGRKLYTEIALIEEEHVTQYESLKDPNCSWLEAWVMHEYTECYLYYSMAHDETDEYIRKIYEEHFEMETAHLKIACDCLKDFENKDYKSLFPKEDFPELLKLGGNKEYIRKVLRETVSLTGDKEDYIDVSELISSSGFSIFQSVINPDVKKVASHDVIIKNIEKFGTDYRYEDKPNPVGEFADRTKDNTSMGRISK